MKAQRAPRTVQDFVVPYESYNNSNDKDTDDDDQMFSMMQQEVDKCATNCVWASHHVVVPLVKLLANLALTFGSCFFVNLACLRFI